MAPKWNQALVRIASAKDPTTLSTTDRVLFYDDRTITIYDAFAKAKYHLLVLPRIPFKLSASSVAQGQTNAPTLSMANGKLNFGASSSNVVPASHMRSISNLLASPYAAQVLDTLRKASDRAVAHIQNDMMEQYGVTWDIERAFHAIPSMEHLHLHVTSMDLVSDRLKHKKHYLSFHPDVGFAVRLDVAEGLVEQGNKSLPRSEQAYEQLLKGSLISHHTGQTFRLFPELKAHLESYWRENTLATSETPNLARKTKAAETKGGLSQPPPPQRRKVEPPDKLASIDAQKSAPSDSEDEPSLPMKR